MRPGRYDRFLPAAPEVSVTSGHVRLAGFDVYRERVGDPEAPVRMLLLHGAGGNAEAMRPYARHLAALGAEVTVPDLPGYGRSTLERPGALRYDDWRRVAAELVTTSADARPLVIVGASLGGMLAYDTAATTGAASAIAVTCLLDPRSPAVRARLSHHALLGRLAGPALRLLAGPLAGLRIPIRWIANMGAIANDSDLVAAVVRDPRGGGSRVALGWMRDYLESTPVIEPEDFATPTWLLHPADDRWTPVEISQAFAERIAAPTVVELLDGCGHFPLERPGFDRMLSAIAEILHRVRA